MRSLARLSNKCSSFCVSTGTGDSSSHIILFLSSLDNMIGSSLTSFQNSFTVFLLFFVNAGGGLFGVFPLSIAVGDLGDLRFTPNNGGGAWGAGGGSLAPRGGGGGARAPPGVGTMGGGGGGTPLVTFTGPRTSTSSSELRSVKSRSQSSRGRFSFLTNSSQCNSFSDFFASWGFVGRLSPVGDFNTSAFDLDLARPSFAFEINPLMSPILWGEGWRMIVIGR